MHWNSYESVKPSPQSKCIVAYYSRGHTMAGIFTYYPGSTSYWRSDDGSIIYCHDKQQWYYVDDIVRVVEERLEQEIRESME